jgi:hypothetical protein
MAMTFGLVINVIFCKSLSLQVFELCEKLGHCGDAAITSALDNGTFQECHLTSQDLCDAREIFGTALPAFGKEPSSDSPLATKVGEHIYLDIIILDGVSYGGNKVILFAVNEKSPETAAQCQHAL